MRLKKTKLPLLLILLFMILQVSIQLGCDGYPSKHIPEDTYSYRFAGVLVKDFNVDMTHIVATLARNDSTLSEAEIRFDGDSLACIADSTYLRAVFPAGAYQADSFDLEIRDSSLFHDTVIVVLAADFAIDSVIPPTRLKTSSDHVSLGWSGSSDAEGYVIAAVKRYSSYTGAGYSQYVTSQATSETFPNDVFILPSDEPDTGWYYLYVYSYVGSPDSALSSPFLPVPMPGQRPDNILLDDSDNILFDGFEGHFGTIVVTRLDSIHVVAE